MGRARRAMELLVLAEVDGVVYSQHREAAVNAARGVLCEEFNDVRLYWRTVGWDTWQLTAKGPGGDADVCEWADLRPDDLNRRAK